MNLVNGLNNAYYVLKPSLFVRRDWEGGVVYARWPDDAFYNVHYSLSRQEVHLLQNLTGRQTITEAARRAGFTDEAALSKFVEWAVRRGLLTSVENAIDSPAGQFDTIFSAADFPREPCPPGTRRQYPVSVTFLLTLRCVFQCSYCFLGQREAPDALLAFERVREILDECRELFIFQWAISGGEVLLYPLLIPLLQELLAHDIFLTQPISTKIAVPAKKLRELSEAGIDQLQYSLDTTDPGLLKEFLGGSGQRCRRYVGHLLKSMREAQRLGFKITVRPTLTHQNYASIPALLATLSASLEDPVHIVFGGVTTPGVATDRPLALSQLDWRHVQELIAQLRAQYPALSMEIKTSAYGEKFGEEADINAVHFPTPQDFVECCYCPANRARLYVLPDGRVTFCTMPAVRNALILGHLNHQSIAEVWHSALAQRLAYPSREDCGDSPCRDCSEFTSCHYLSGKCLALVADTYGIDNLHLPDPRCPVKPQAVVC